MYWIINLKDDREEVGKIMLNLAFGSFYILIYLLVFKNIRLPSWQGLVGAAYIGLFEMSITFVIWLRALQFSVNTAKVSNLIYLSPFIALFWIRLAVGEHIYPATVAGLAIVVAGIIMQQMTGKEKIEK